MNKTEKSEMVSLIKEKFEQSTAMYLVDYSGVTVEEISGLRREFAKEGASYKVFKNTFPSIKDVLEAYLLRIK